MTDPTDEEILDFSKIANKEDEIILDFTQVAKPPPRPELSDEQKIVRDNPGSTLVIAAPGAGKTEVLTQRHERLESEGKRCISLTFTVAAAQEIKRRIPGAEASTIHAFCFKNTGYKFPQTEGGFPTLLRNYVMQKDKRPYDEVLVDEAQNLSPLMLSVIKAIPKQSLFAVGDPYQSCYIGEWARSLWDAPALGKEAFDSLSKECRTLEIKGNRRSSSPIVGMLEHLNMRSLKALGPKNIDRDLVAARTHIVLEKVSSMLAGHEIPHILYKRRDAEDTKYTVVGTNPKVDVIIFHQLIGTEARRVFILDWNPPSRGTLNDEIENFNLLYTTAARATSEVYMVEECSGMSTYMPPNIPRISFERMFEILKDRKAPK